MITYLQIRNFVIVEKLDLEFANGMTVLTGETGAGKSIIIDALGMTLGERADQDSIRHQCKRAEILVSLNVANHAAALDWLKSNHLDEQHECIIRRTITRDSGSRAFINDRPVSLHHLKALANQLIAIHSQHQHQALLQRTEQQRLLDAFANHLPQVHQLTQLYTQHQSLQKIIQGLQTEAAERDQKIDFLAFQLKELDTLALKPEEWAQLDNEQKRLSHQELIAKTINHALYTFSEKESAISQEIDTVSRQIKATAEYDHSLKNIVDLIESAHIQINEAIADLRHQRNHVVINDQDIQRIDERINAILDIARKHRCEPNDLPNIQHKLQGELSQIQNTDHQLVDLQHQLTETANQYNAIADIITQGRQDAATRLDAKINQLLPKLGMQDSQFMVQLTSLGTDEISLSGREKIEFRIQSNPGQPAKPIQKIASGGELSRISLAIQVATADISHVPSIIFDEVDVGISGGIAETVGTLLQQLAQNHQVICITHQAQVAAKGHQHLQINKIKSTHSVTTSLVELNNPQRIDEIARMIGGLEITGATQQHAKEMLNDTGQPSPPQPKSSKTTVDKIIDDA